MKQDVEFSMYEPSTRAAMFAAEDFLNRMDAWDKERARAERQLKSICVEHGGAAQPVGFLSKDALNMSVFGVVFDAPPKSGFMPAPSSVSVAAREGGARGLAYIPDVKTDAGRTIFGAMMKLSTVGESRPILGIKGVHGISLDGKRLSMATAVRTSDGIRVMVSPSAVKPGSEVVQMAAAAIAKRPGPNAVSRPSPFNEQ